jgi:2-polyprenyl-3-methyl-5-hydroxy-6-metoxy-1,4-benzoquinol methylase
MAQIYTWDRQGFQDAYWRYIYKVRGCGAATRSNCRCNDSYTTYTRTFFDTNDLFRQRAEHIINTLSLPQGSSVLVVGCALGYLMEELQKLKMIPYGFDNSTYINGAKGKEKVKFAIPNIDILSDTIQQDLNKAFNISAFDCVITEDVLPSHDSFDKIFSNCDSLLKNEHPKSRIVHIVQTDAPMQYTSYTLDQWKQLNANHTWLNQNGEDI